MKNYLLVGLLMLALGLNGQKFSVMFHYGDSLLSEDAFQNIDTSNQITTGILWDRAYPNIQLPAYQTISFLKSLKVVTVFQNSFPIFIK